MLHGSPWVYTYSHCHHHPTTAQGSPRTVKRRWRKCILQPTHVGGGRQDWGGGVRDPNDFAPTMAPGKFLSVNFLFPPLQNLGGGASEPPPPPPSCGCRALALGILLFGYFQVHWCFARGAGVDGSTIGGICEDRSMKTNGAHLFLVKHSELDHVFALIENPAGLGEGEKTLFPAISISNTN